MKVEWISYIIDIDIIDLIELSDLDLELNDSNDGGPNHLSINVDINLRKNNYSVKKTFPKCYYLIYNHDSVSEFWITQIIQNTDCWKLLVIYRIFDLSWFPYPSVRLIY